MDRGGWWQKLCAGFVLLAASVAPGAAAECPVSPAAPVCAGCPSCQGRDIIRTGRPLSEAEFARLVARGQFTPVADDANREPSDRELRRAGLVPLARMRPDDEMADASASGPTGTDALPGGSVVTPPRIVSAVHAPAPASTGDPRPDADSDGHEHRPSGAAAWRAVSWGGPLGVKVVDAPSGGFGKALHLVVGEAEGDGSRTPSEKWGVSLADAALADMVAVDLDVLNALDWPVKLAMGVFVEREGKRVYYESQPRRLPSGWSRNLRFSGDATNWKTEAEDWRFVASWQGKGAVREIVFLLYDAPALPGVYLDRIRTP